MLAFVLAVSTVIVAGSAIQAQTPASAPAAPPPQVVPAGERAPTAHSQETGGGLAPGTPPVAIVPLDKSIPGAALSVAGSMQAWNGRAYVTGSGSITAGAGTAQVTLPYRGTMHVCASSTVKLAADSSTPAGEVPGLLIALDHGAVEMSLAASTARQHNADTLLTPYFRILIGGPEAADVKVRLGENGDTCVDNSGVNAPYVVVTSVFEGGIYRVQAGQRVMFEHGSLHEVVDQEKEPCGCPPPPKSEPNEFPLAQSEGLAPAGSAAPVSSALTGHAPNATDTFSVSGADRAAQAAAPPAAAPAAQAKAPSTEKKPGLLRRIGRFFRRVFGAE
ncbi:MAG: hypothetical protein ABSF23_09275 [Terracidiphilus sp.]|jgi:hypothetical protein